ncbi:MAG: methyl-accepting chemotaxis protein [Treponema sp.]|jgi:methyl-accepting chemotaxis protein|nr:methyl-accepting chemotaxis protein [Treponema sp.]
MKNKKHVFIILIAACGIAMGIADFFVLAVFEPMLSGLHMRFGLPALAFVLVYTVILGRNGRCFDPAFFSNATEDEILKRLKAIGSVPIRMIAMTAVLHSLFVGLLFFKAEYLGLNPDTRGSLYLMVMSLGLTVGLFVYVVCDGLVSRALIVNSLTHYPRTLREGRQALKAMIVPAAAVLVSIVYTRAVTMLGTGSGVGIAPLIIFFLLIAVLAFFLKRNSASLFEAVTEQLDNLSSDKKDLRRRICVCCVDEIATITGLVNTFSEHVGEGIRDIKDGQKELSTVGMRLEKNASGMAASISRISGASEQVLVKTRGQLESVNSASRTTHEMIGHIKSLEESINIQSSSMSQASSAVEKMVGNISSIGTVTEKMASQFETVGEAADEGSRIQKENGERIQAIVEESEALQEANRIIAAIAAQTNLLAMNAAFEAAHAGELGRGFSVVADEIRKLAENASSESHKISAELKKIAGTINQIVKDATATGDAFNEVSQRINETEKLVIEVNNAVHEQKTGAGQVIDSLRVMNEITAKVSGGSREMSQGSESMLQEINALQKSAGDIETSMEEMSEGIRNINSGAQEVSNLAVNVHSSIEKISAIANSFEV